MESELFELVVNEIAATMDIPAASLHIDATLAEIGMDSLEALRGYPDANDRTSRDGYHQDPAQEMTA